MYIHIYKDTRVWFKLNAVVPVHHRLTAEQWSPVSLGQALEKQTKCYASKEVSKPAGFLGARKMVLRRMAPKDSSPN